MNGRTEARQAPPDGGRLDLVLTALFPEHSRSRLQQWIRDGRVAVGGVAASRPGQRLQGGEALVLDLPAPTPTTAGPEAIPLDVVYEDHDLLVVDKPPGMVVHPSAGHDSGTLVNAVLAHAPDLAGVGGEIRPGIVHRLDRDTSGLIVVAKHDRALRILQRQFRDQMVRKVYLAIVDGGPPDRQGRVDAPLGRDPRHRQRIAVVPPTRGREAVTEYLVRERHSSHAFLECRPQTGRTHQIRVHLAFLGCPIAGDRVYGLRKPSPEFPRQMLHAWRLTLHLPGAPDVVHDFEAPMPADMQLALELVRRRSTGGSAETPGCARHLVGPSRRYDPAQEAAVNPELAVDLRSDTVTRPTAAMRRAMAEAEVGDDVFGEDPTVNRLEEQAAVRLGKEAAVFVPSGTMGNLAAVLSHCRRGDEMILGELSHTYLLEAGGAAALGGVHPRPLANLPDGSLDLEQVASAVRLDDDHFPVSRLICIENTHNRCGGVALGVDYLDLLGALAGRHGLLLHMDGARIFNAAAATGSSAADLARAADSVTFCLSKGLCAPVGSVLCGREAFIRQARRARKQLGGGMRQAGVLAAAGLVALETMTDRLTEDHARARVLAEGLREIEGLHLETDPPATNMVFFELHPPSPWKQKVWSMPCCARGS